MLHHPHNFQAAVMTAHLALTDLPCMRTNGFHCASAGAMTPFYNVGLNMQQPVSVMQHVVGCCCFVSETASLTTWPLQDSMTVQRASLAVKESRPEVGSSSSSTRGLVTSAIPMFVRLHCPPALAQQGLLQKHDEV